MNLREKLMPVLGRKLPHIVPCCLNCRRPYWEENGKYWCNRCQSTMPLDGTVVLRKIYDDDRSI